MLEESQNQARVGAPPPMIAGTITRQWESEEVKAVLTAKEIAPTIINDDDKQPQSVQPSADLEESSQYTNPPTSGPSNAHQNAIVKYYRTSFQPTRETLAEYGIKVRDFAYENTLPPIAPVSRVPRQIQPGLIPSKRARDDYEEDSTDRIRAVGSSAERVITSLVPHKNGRKTKKPKVIERKPTEPIENHLIPCRTLGYTDLSQYNNQQLGPSRTVHSSPHTPKAIPINAPVESPPRLTESQESESYVDTPLITPNGSLQLVVHDTSFVPTSQLDVYSPEHAPGPHLVVTSPITPIPSSSRLNITPLLFTHEAPTSATNSRSDLHSTNARWMRAKRNADTTSTDSPSHRYLLRRRSLLSVPPRLLSHPYTVKVSPPKTTKPSRARRVR